jgi:hypothetical protein
MDHDCYLDLAAQLETPQGVRRLKRRLGKKVETTLWICALSVNQHAGICGSFGEMPPAGTPERQEWDEKRLDTVSKLPHPVCQCRQPKHFSQNRAACEMNKFDDMLAYLSKRAGTGFALVIYVDETFDIFSRAWCVAELVEASMAGLRQHVKIPSEDSLVKYSDDLLELDVRASKAARPEDKQEILARIKNVDTFNEHLQWLIFGSEGLFKDMVDGVLQWRSVGKIALRSAKRLQLPEDLHPPWSFCLCLGDYLRRPALSSSTSPNTSSYAPESSNSWLSQRSVSSGFLLVGRTHGMHSRRQWDDEEDGSDSDAGTESSSDEAFLEEGGSSDRTQSSSSSTSI